MEDVVWTDLMVDVETTGLNPQLNGVIQVGAIKFNLAERKVGPMFDRCPMLLPFRQWDESTRQFWQIKHRDVYMSIVARQEPGEQVFRDLDKWVGDPNIRVWMKPTHFDWGFVSTHMEQVGMPVVGHYRYARDLNSYMAGLAGAPDHVLVEEAVPFPEGGKPHNALHDSAWQIDQLFYAQDHA